MVFTVWAIWHPLSVRMRKTCQKSRNLREKQSEKGSVQTSNRWCVYRPWKYSGRTIKKASRMSDVTSSSKTQASCLWINTASYDEERRFSFSKLLKPPSVHVHPMIHGRIHGWIRRWGGTSTVQQIGEIGGNSRISRSRNRRKPQIGKPLTPRKEGKGRGGE